MFSILASVTIPPSMRKSLKGCCLFLRVADDACDCAYRPAPQFVLCIGYVSVHQLQEGDCRFFVLADHVENENSRIVTFDSENRLWWSLPYLARPVNRNL